MKNQLHKVLAGSLLAIYAVNGVADEINGNLNVNATVETTCTVNSPTLDFGTFDTVTPDDAQTTISVTCTSGSDYSVYLGAGTGTAATVTNRSMTASGPSAFSLYYQLYTDAGHAEIWGDGTVGTGYQCGTGSGAAQDFFVYGQIPTTGTNPNAPADTYTDVVVIDVVY